MSDRRIKPWTPAKGEQYEAVNVGNVTVKLYRRRRVTANGKNKRKKWAHCIRVGRLYGVRRLRGFGDLDEARREVDKIARQLASGKATAAAMTNAQAAT